MTPKQLDRIMELLETRPQCRLITGCSGIVTCDGMAIEFNGGVIHPLTFLDMMEGAPLEPLDILK